MGIFFNQNDKTKGWAAKRRLSQALMADAARKKTYRSPWEGIGELAEFYVGHKKGQEADTEEKESIAAKEAEAKAKQDAKIQALSAAFGAGDRDQVTQALMSNPDTADYGFKMKMQGFDQKSKMDMLQQELTMRGEASRNNVVDSSNIRGFEKFNTWDKAKQNSYSNFVRGNKMYDMGGGYQRFDNEGNPQDYYQKTVKTEDGARFKADVAQQTTAATEGEKSRQAWLKTVPEQTKKLEKMQYGVSSMNEKITEAKEMINTMTTGVVGGLLSNLPESDAGILRGRLNQVKAIVTNEIVSNMTGVQTNDDAERHAQSLGAMSNSDDPKEIIRALDNLSKDMIAAYDRDMGEFTTQQKMYSQPQQAQQARPTDTSGGIPARYGKTKMQPTKYDGLLKELADKAGVPWDLARAVSYAESAGNPNARSRVGAQGLMQVMPDTLKDAGYGVSPAKNGSIRETSRVGMEYLGAMLKEYNGDVDKALAAYNAGVGTVRKYGGVPPYKETQKYIGRIKGYMTPEGQRNIPAPKSFQPIGGSTAQGVQSAIPIPATNGVTPPLQPIGQPQAAPPQIAPPAPQAVATPQQMVAESTPPPVAPPVPPPQPQAPTFDVNAAVSKMAAKDSNITMHNLTETAKARGMTVEQVLRQMGYK